MFGPDSKSSLTINEIKKLVEGVAFIENLFSAELISQIIVNLKNLKPFLKSLAVNKEMKAGEELVLNVLELKTFGVWH